MAFEQHVPIGEALPGEATRLVSPMEAKFFRSSYRFRWLSQRNRRELRGLRETDLGLRVATRALAPVHVVCLVLYS